VRVREKAPSATTAARPAIKSRARSLIGLVCLCGLGLAAFLGSGAPLAGAAGVEAPRVDHTFVSEVSESEATLHAEINPGEAATTYRFQYLTEQQFHEAGETFAGAAETPAQPLKDNAGNEAEDNEDHLATATISGLQPDTAYRYRVVATNTAGAGEGEVFRNSIGTYIRTNYRGFHTRAPAIEEADTCPNATIREEQHSTFLPDCRAYEQVSPPQKNGADVTSSQIRTFAAADGNAVAYLSLEGFGDVHGGGAGFNYLARRGPDGSWTTHALDPAQQQLGTGLILVSGGFDSYYPLFSEDLSHAIFVARSPLTEDPNSAATLNLYRRDDVLSPGPGTYRLVTESSSPQAANIDVPALNAASSDFSHISFESKLDLTADAAGLDPTQPKLYEWVEGGVHLVGILPADEGGEPTVSQAGQDSLTGHQSTTGTMSRDGHRIVFTTPPLSEDLTGGVLYLRDDQGTPSLADDTTVRVSASERTDCSDDPTCGGDGIPDPEPDPANPGGQAPPATFWAMSADGSKIFFTTPEQLTDDDVNHASDLYRFDVNAPAGSRLTRISVDRELADNGGDPHQGADVSGVIGASGDGSYVYFTVTEGQLVTGGPIADDGGPLSTARIFAWHQGTLHEVGGVNRATEQRSIDGLDPPLFPRWSRLSPDGTHLTFITEGSQELLSLHGKPEYDHGTACLNLNPQCKEVYVYDATINGGAGDLRCASCDPSGPPASSDADFYGSGADGGQDPVGATASTFHVPHVISDDGRYVFFNTAEALVPRDTNGVRDAYVYDTTTEEPELLSTGTSPDPSTFLDASADGGNAFFVTRQRLVGTDTDESVDLYDARVGGGSPEPSPQPAACIGLDQCHPPSTSPPPPAAASALNGPGNPTPKHCGAGKVRRHGKCVKKKPPHRHHRRTAARHGGSR
jgi:hypothetical protein